MPIEDIIRQAIEEKASDIFLIANISPGFKINGKIIQTDREKLSPASIKEMVKDIYQISNNRNFEEVERTGDDDFSFSIRGLGRMRVNVFKQRGSFAAVIRIVLFDLPKFEELNIPESVMNLTDYKKGLVLITGSAGSGKSTTLACLINKINETQSKHIITMEDPIEYMHPHKKSIVSQREINLDTKDYLVSLRAALRQSPDIIQLGEMRDNETIQVAMTAAETGQLLFSTLHTTGAANTIDRIVDVFPENQQQQVRIQLSMMLQAVVSQQLIPSKDGKLVPAFEVMKVNLAIRNLIRESKIHQIDAAIFAGTADGMCTMDMSIYKLYSDGVIDEEQALIYSSNQEWMRRKIKS